MGYKKIFETSTKRFYRLSQCISLGKFGPIRPTYYVLISDSNILDERLAFAFYFLPGHRETDFKNGSQHFIVVDKVHIMGELASTLQRCKTTLLPSDHELLCKIIEMNL